jgi:outer membrane receptor protein involved in Fe transport
MSISARHRVRLALALGAMPLAVIAQERAPAEGEFELEEIVVTAQKIEQSLRDVPLSVEALLGEKLTDAAIIRLDDLKAYVPNLQMSETGIANNIYIRGIGSGLNQGFEQSVSLYQDGVYRGRGHQARMPFLDLARVEVLRGPQPILFGKNAVAGAVNMVAARPTAQFQARARVSHDIEIDETTADVVVSGPFSDSVRGRVAVFHRSADGYLTNRTLNEGEPARNDLAGRAMLQADLSGALTATLRVEAGRFETDGRQIEIFGETPIAAANPFRGLTYSQALAGLITNGGGTPPPGLVEPAGNSVDYFSGTAPQSYSNIDSREVALTLDYSLGNGATFTSVTAYSTYELDEFCDCDFVAAPLITAGIVEDYRQYSQELRLASAADARVRWIGGLFFQRYELEESDYLAVPANSLVPPLIAAATVPQLLGPNRPCTQLGLNAGQCSALVQGFFRGASNPRDFTQDSSLYSAFLQTTIALNEKWSVSLGGRLNHEKKEGSRATYLIDANGNDISNPIARALYDQVLGIQQHALSGSRKETNFSPLVNLQYRYSDRSMAYLSAARGYKAGGFDARSNRATKTVGGNQVQAFEFEDERATTFEFGLKSGIGTRAELNLAAFFTDYKDLQTTAFDGSIGFNVDNGTAEVRGIELESRWRPFGGGLLLEASAALLDFEWTDYEGQCYFDLIGTSACDAGGNAQYAGRDNQFAPTYSGVVSAEYGWNVGSLRLRAVADMTFTDDYLQSPNLDPVLVQKGFAKFNARFSLGDLDQRWELALVGRNLTDQTTVSYAADTPLASRLFSARSYYGFVDPPRAIAIEGRIRF